MARVSLLVVVVGGAAVVIALSAGAANPPKAGPLVFEQSTPVQLTALPGQCFTSPNVISLAAGAYTLEVTGQLAADSDPTVTWGIVFVNGATQAEPFSVMLSGYRFLAVSPSKPDFAPFIHVRANGQPNTLTLTTERDGKATLRINDEIAWTGTAPDVSGAVIRAVGGRTSSSELTVQHVALYAASPLDTQTPAK